MTIILQARYIPDGTTVRKPTGENEYLFRTNGVPVYTYLGKTPADKRTVLEGSLVLQSNKNLSVCAPEHHLAIDFEFIQDAFLFLEEVCCDAATTIEIEAAAIPEGQVIRKPTGKKNYLMQRSGLKIYSNDYRVYGGGKLHMICGEHIVLLGSSEKLALDFTSPALAGAFLEEIY